jgi:hypothetical protein
MDGESPPELSSPELLSSCDNANWACNPVTVIGQLFFEAAWSL